MDHPAGRESGVHAADPRALNLAQMSKRYRADGLDVADLAEDPVDQFSRWLDDAVTADLVEPNAMTLATADAQGRPAARTVLLKGLDRGGFVFYTNYQSRKGEHLRENPACALLFTWLPLTRQVAIQGSAERVLPEDSDAYFALRPRGSQIGAWASPQSQVISGRAELDQRQREMEQRFPTSVPRPPHWGGYRVVPTEIEFWQGRPNRLHDRLRYRRSETDDRGWVIERLGP